MATFLRAIVTLLFFCIHGASTQQTNLPDVPPGVFNASARIEIQTTIAAAWDALTDFPKYPNWNPFVRSAIVTNALGIPLPADQQRPVENKGLVFRVQIPPLPFPVDASTPDNPLHTQFSAENITHVQPELGRLAWKYIVPDVLLGSERWSALSTLPNGKVLYESREVYSGILAGTTQALYAEGLQQGFEAQAQALKMLLEG